MRYLDAESSPALLSVTPETSCLFSDTEVTMTFKWPTNVLPDLTVGGEVALREGVPEGDWALVRNDRLYDGTQILTVRRGRSWGRARVYWLLSAVESGVRSYATGSFSVDLPEASPPIRGRVDPFDGSVELVHQIAGAVRLQLRRGRYAFPETTSEGELVYDGPPTDRTVDTAAAFEGFHYYTLFVGTSEDELFTNSGLQVAVRRSSPLPRHYVYERWVPAEVRRKDADSSRGTDAYYLRTNLDLVQGFLSTWSGSARGLTDIRDPDSAPAGALGVAEGQTSILLAAVSDLGAPAEQAFDSGVLRRLYSGFGDVAAQKGTNESFRAFTKVFTLWDSRVESPLDHRCGIFRLVSGADLEPPVWDSQAGSQESALGFGSGFGTDFGG